MHAHGPIAAALLHFRLRRGVLVDCWWPSHSAAHAHEVQCLVLEGLAERKIDGDGDTFAALTAKGLDALRAVDLQLAEDEASAKRGRA